MKIDNERLKRVFEILTPAVREIFGDRLHSLILYGSFARGEAHSDSDVDCLLVLKGDVNPYQDRISLTDILAEINIEMEELISLIPVSEDRYLNSNEPLLLNIRREGFKII